MASILDEKDILNPQDNDEEQEKSEVDKVQEGVDRARAARERIRQAKKVADFARKKIAKRLVARGATRAAAAATSEIWLPILAVIGIGLLILVAVVFLIVIIIMFINQDSGTGEEVDVPGSGNVPTIPGLELGKAAPTDVGSGEVVAYTISATYSASLDVVVYDPIAANVEYVSSDPPGEYDELDRIISWRLSDFEPTTEQDGARVYTFQLSLRPNFENGYITNQAFAYALGTGPGNNPESGAPPNTETCNGFYSLDNPIGLNFGDAGCEYAVEDDTQVKDQLYSLLVELDPANADFWFSQVIPCESSFNPNTYYRTGAAGDTPDSGGAWGLYQMGSTYGEENFGSGHGQYDKGDVPWRQQTSNAINYYYQVMGGTDMGAYWACARPEFFR